MIMGDGYCRHCDDEDEVIPVNREFLLALVVHMKRKALVTCKHFLQEEIRGGCDYCRGERSEQLLALVEQALARRRAKRSPGFHQMRPH
jgi:hypothetical protein